MVEEQASGAGEPKLGRRRASRAAGPAGGKPLNVLPEAIVVSAPTASRTAKSKVTVLPRRQPNRGRVALVSAVAAVVAAAVLVTVVLALLTQYRHAEAATARQQRFVDTGEQTVLNMFSYNQNNIDESVNRFVDGTSGPLRDMMSQGKNVDNLKAIFRDTQASSEAVVSGAALEKIDEVGRNAAVLVAVRVTVTDIDGVNKPSQAYRMRVVVHEDDNGHMTGYDLKYPEGGN